MQGKKKPAFQPPTLEAVMEYAKERGNKIDPIAFFDFYEANGWVQGKNKPLKDWKAAVRTWERNGVVITNSSRNGQRTENQNATGRYCEVRSDTPAKATRHTTL